MHSRERVLTAINHQEPDRVPINYPANPEIDINGKHDTVFPAFLYFSPAITSAIFSAWSFMRR
jgi:hypothetical protein